MAEELFDFGFTAVAEEELDAARAANQATDEANELRARLDSLYKSILPLVTNLKKNPEKDYIYWPSRLEKVQNFERMLKKIYEGS
jgi:hypothetical protein